MLTARCISSSSPVELQYCLRTTLHIDALAPASELFVVVLFLVANLKRGIVKMGNVACASVSGACAFACHVCSGSPRHPFHTHAPDPRFCDILPICIFGDVTQRWTFKRKKANILEELFTAARANLQVTPPGSSFTHLSLSQSLKST